MSPLLCRFEYIHCVGASKVIGMKMIELFFDEIKGIVAICIFPVSLVKGKSLFASEHGPFSIFYSKIMGKSLS